MTNSSVLKKLFQMRRSQAYIQFGGDIILRGKYIEWVYKPILWQCFIIRLERVWKMRKTSGRKHNLDTKQVLPEFTATSLSLSESAQSL